MRTRDEISAFILKESDNEEISKADIKVKVKSGECLAKNVAAA